MDMLISQSLYQIMLAHTQSAFPQEACGLLAGHENHISHLYLIENILQSPVAFEMNAQQQIEAMINAEEQEFRLIAVYHSHPKGPQTPSITDKKQAYYPELTQIIISLHERSNPITRAFTIINEEVTEIRLILE